MCHPHSQMVYILYAWREYWIFMVSDMMSTCSMRMRQKLTTSSKVTATSPPTPMQVSARGNHLSVYLYSQWAVSNHDTLLFKLMILNKVAGLYLLIETFIIVNSIATTKLHFYEFFRGPCRSKQKSKGVHSGPAEGSHPEKEIFGRGGRCA